jgi:hydrogenase maturation protease
MRTIVLGIGNDLLGDDGAGVEAARRLAHHSADGIDVVETSQSGAALMEYLIGYDRAILIDAVSGSDCPSGTVMEFKPADFKQVQHPSPHYAGLPELIDLAKQCNLPFPREIDIIGIEVSDRFTIGAPISPPVERGIEAAVSLVTAKLNR